MGASNETTHQSSLVSMGIDHMGALTDQDGERVHGWWVVGWMDGWVRM